MAMGFCVTIEQMANTSSWHFTLSEQCAQLFEDKACIFLVSAFTSDVRSTGQCKPNRGYQLIQQKVLEVERRPCRSIMHLFSEGAPVLSWLTCALGKTKTAKEKQLRSSQCTDEVWYCSGAVFVLHMSLLGFRSWPKGPFTSNVNDLRLMNFEPQAEMQCIAVGILLSLFCAFCHMDLLHQHLFATSIHHCVKYTTVQKIGFRKIF